MTTTIENEEKRVEAAVQIQGITVKLIFSDRNNTDVPTLVRDVLKSAYANQRTA